MSRALSIKKDARAFFLQLKSSIGFGFLFFPHGFSLIGYVNGCLIIIGLTIVNIMTFYQYKKIIEEFEHQSEWSSFQDMIANSLKKKHDFFKKYYVPVNCFISTCMAGNVMGAVCAYTYLTADLFYE
ncbi:MAG: hypothetical protein MHPSP_003349, partial [Paramarteilia canceri]